MMYLIDHRCNSLNRVKHALQADGFECDVQLTKDQVPILFHDAMVHDGKKIAALTYEECVARYPREAFATVEQVCAYLSQETSITKPWTIFWEIKTADDALPVKLYDVIHQCDYAPTIRHVFISFLPKQLQRLRRHSNTATLGLSIRDLGVALSKQDVADQFGLSHTDELPEALTSFSSLALNMVTIDVQLLERCNYQLPFPQMPVVCWTVNDTKQMAKLEGTCQYVISDDLV